MSESGPTNIVTSLSIEETNKIRLSLGLKPLKVETNTTSSSSKESKPTQQAQQSNDEASLDVLDTINKLKKKRELNSKLKGKSIAEQLLEGEDEDDEDDVSNWVSKSRNNEKEKQIEKKNNLKNNLKNNNNSKQQQRYNQNNLQGIKVGNDIKNFDDENEHILTLQDSNVLDDDYEDVLVNVNISEKEKREKLIQGSKKKSKFDKYDDFGEHKGGILDEYDDDNDKDDSGFVLGSGGTVVDQSTSNGNNSQESLRDQAKKNLASLASYNMEQNTTNSILSSFYSQEEMDRFKKNRENKSNNGKEKKKKKLRKKSETDNILNQLDATTSSDLGSRKNRGQTEKERKEIENQREREENYKKALDKANEDNTSSKPTVTTADYYEEAEDEDFYNSLTNSKKAPILSQKNIAEIIVNKKKQQQQTNKQEEDEDDGTNNLEEITINPTVEFARSLNPDGLISNYRTSSASTTNNNNNNNKDDEEMEDVQDSSNNNNNNNRNEDSDDDDDDDDDDEDNENKNKKKSTKNIQPILPEEPLVSGSVSAALRLFAQKGDLQPNPTTNSKKRGINYDSDESTIIEHKDEFGRVMNRKEAFVKMSQIFHGKKSGKNKMEKRKRLYEEELKKMKMDSTDTPLGMVKSFQSYQQQTNSPYLVISGGSSTNILKQNLAGGKQQ